MNRYEDFLRPMQEELDQALLTVIKLVNTQRLHKKDAGLEAADIVNKYAATSTELPKFINNPAHILEEIARTSDNNAQMSIHVPDPLSNLGFSPLLTGTILTDRQTRVVFPLKPPLTKEQFTERDLMAQEVPQRILAVIIAGFNAWIAPEDLLEDVRVIMKDAGLEYDHPRMVQSLQNPDPTDPYPAKINVNMTSRTFSLVLWLQKGCNCTTPCDCTYLTNPDGVTQFQNGKATQTRSPFCSNMIFISYGPKRVAKSGEQGPPYSRRYVVNCITREEDLPQTGRVILFVLSGLGRDPSINHAVLKLFMDDIITQSGVICADDLTATIEPVVHTYRIQGELRKINVLEAVIRVQNPNEVEQFSQSQAVTLITDNSPPVKVSYLGHQLTLSTDYAPNKYTEHQITSTQTVLKVTNSKLPLEEFSRQVRQALPQECVSVIIRRSQTVYLTYSELGHPATPQMLTAGGFVTPTIRPLQRIEVIPNKNTDPYRLTMTPTAQARQQDSHKATPQQHHSQPPGTRTPYRNLRAIAKHDSDSSIDSSLSVYSHKSTPSASDPDMALTLQSGFSRQMAAAFAAQERNIEERLGNIGAHFEAQIMSVNAELGTIKADNNAAQTTMALLAAQQASIQNTAQATAEALNRVVEMMSRQMSAGSQPDFQMITAHTQHPLPFPGGASYISAVKRPSSSPASPTQSANHTPTSSPARANKVQAKESQQNVTLVTTTSSSTGQGHLPGRRQS